MHELQGPQKKPTNWYYLRVLGNIFWSKQQRSNSQIVTRGVCLAGCKAWNPTSCTTDNNPYKGSISNMHTLTSSEAKKQKKIKLIMACLECLVLYYWFMSVPTYFLTVHDDVKARQVLWSDLRLLMSEESIVGYKEWRVTLIPLKYPNHFFFFFA